MVDIMTPITYDTQAKRGQLENREFADRKGRASPTGVTHGDREQ